jgi:cathepsin L
MRLAILAVLIACASAASVFDATLNNQWTIYKSVHSKSYGKDDSMRRLIWEANHRFVAKHNAEFKAGIQTYEVEINRFADMTLEEFRTMYNTFNASKVMKARQGTPYKVSGAANPTEVDWRKEGYVTPVKDQGQCGSCWAFSTVASLEGQHFKASKELVSLSEQNLVDCSRAEGNQGCNGGLMDQGFEYIKKNGGIDTEESYPYKAVDQKCKFSKDNVGATLTSWTDVKSQDESALEDALANVGPISVAIDASHSGFQLYKSGVYDQFLCSSTRLDHGVTAVGYGVLDGKDYWIVKNSWGEVWGLKGYILMSRNKSNQCGIATQASYPVV